MIRGMSHTTIYVKDQAAALDFYVNKLGLEVRTDVSMEGFRWLTVGVKGQKDLEIVLMQPMAGSMVDEKTVQKIRELLDKGALGAGVFATTDCRATYDELKSKGVEFVSPPKEKPYGVEAIFRDNSGNWFSLTQARH